MVGHAEHLHIVHGSTVESTSISSATGNTKYPKTKIRTRRFDYSGKVPAVYVLDIDRGESHDLSLIGVGSAIADRATTALPSGCLSPNTQTSQIT